MFIPSNCFPAHADLVTMLMVERHQMPPLQTLEFWLCVDHDDCRIVRDARKTFGIFKRGRIDIYFTNAQIEQLATDLLDGLADSYARVAGNRRFAQLIDATRGHGAMCPCNACNEVRSA